MLADDEEQTDFGNLFDEDNEGSGGEVSRPNTLPTQEDFSDRDTYDPSLVTPSQPTPRPSLLRRAESLESVASQQNSSGGNDEDRERVTSPHSAPQSSSPASPRRLMSGPGTPRRQSSPILMQGPPENYLSPSVSLDSVHDQAIAQDTDDFRRNISDLPGECPSSEIEEIDRLFNFLSDDVFDDEESFVRTSTPVNMASASEEEPEESRLNFDDLSLILSSQSTPASSRRNSISLEENVPESALHTVSLGTPRVLSRANSLNDLSSGAAEHLSRQRTNFLSAETESFLRTTSSPDLISPLPETAFLPEQQSAQTPGSLHNNSCGDISDSLGSLLSEEAVPPERSTSLGHLSSRLSTSEELIPIQDLCPLRLEQVLYPSPSENSLVTQVQPDSSLNDPIETRPRDDSGLGDSQLSLVQDTQLPRVLSQETILKPQPVDGVGGQEESSHSNPADGLEAEQRPSTSQATHDRERSHSTSALSEIDVSDVELEFDDEFASDIDEGAGLEFDDEFAISDTEDFEDEWSGILKAAEQMMPDGRLEIFLEEADPEFEQTRDVPSCSSDLSAHEPQERREQDLDLVSTSSPLDSGALKHKRDLGKKRGVRPPTRKSNAPVCEVLEELVLPSTSSRCGNRSVSKVSRIPRWIKSSILGAPLRSREKMALLGSKRSRIPVRVGARLVRREEEDALSPMSSPTHSAGRRSSVYSGTSSRRSSIDRRDKNERRRSSLESAHDQRMRSFLDASEYRGQLARDAHGQRLGEDAARLGANTRSRHAGAEARRRQSEINRTVLQRGDQAGQDAAALRRQAALEEKRRHARASQRRHFGRMSNHESEERRRGVPLTSSGNLLED